MLTSNNVLQNMHYNLNGGNSFMRNNNLYDNYGYNRGTVDYMGRIQDNNGLYSGYRYNNGNLFNSYESRLGYSDNFGRLRDNLGRDLGGFIR